jgi:hypothetical protein
MLEWLKNHIPLITAMVVSVCLIFYQYGCESTVKSLIYPNEKVNRAELNLELEQLVAKAGLRVSQLDQQDQLRKILFENALIIAQGQALSPLGLITAFGAVYGFGSAVSTVSKKLAVINNKGITSA